MVLCGVECVQNIAKYLNVPVKKIHTSENNVVASDSLIKNQTVEGFITIIQSLVKSSKCQDIFGANQITEALTIQWLEYAILYINYADIPVNAKRVLKELNVALKSNTYITGTNKTIADIALYYSLHSVMNGLSQQEQGTYVNVSRWFDNIQQEEKLRNKLNIVNFDLMHLYI
ncbi:hypothetical protein HCN44_009738 [Aphidius gifuensis]|uniref:GST C-terminal domain-containing protein n=1 Tax=Aphidius gifuensis TaxID=684658 RepID=A0A834Y2T9_APHGI|nr:eukaryotic translation elongation factor 1 epsilon-1 [Aphidius gifuensis]KAF7998340.1 hypothetical protein HCN44_009738 [Aphidius gifuensis]